MKCIPTSSASSFGEAFPTPSYLGYNYLANPLASMGWIVLSVDTNNLTYAGVPEVLDSGLWWTRGLLALKNIQVLADWNAGSPANGGVNAEGAQQATVNDELADIFRGKVDLSRVSLMGHSRGGEGVKYTRTHLSAHDTRTHLRAFKHNTRVHAP